MGKASSAKKVARAARAGGRASGVRERNLLFPGIIGAIVVLGVALIAVARTDYQDAASTVEPRAFESHWHAAYGVYVCGEWIPIEEGFETPTGIHSHADGAIHIHPTSRRAAGENARLGLFIEESPLLDISDTELTVGDQTWEEGVDTCDVDGEEVPGEVVVAQWLSVIEDDNPAVFPTGFKDLRFREDGEGYVLAFVPEGETDDIPKPPSTAILGSLSDALDDIVSPDVAGEIDAGDLPDEVDLTDRVGEGSYDEDDDPDVEGPVPPGDDTDDDED